MLINASERRATIADVAAAAGVSTMTVSRVLNNQGGASEETRQRVLAAATQLQYAPNVFAKGLKNDRSRTIGFVVPDIANPFFPEIIRGADIAARSAGYTLLTCNVVEDPTREEEILSALLTRRVDGVIVCSARLSDQKLFAALGKQRAAVLINRAAPRSAAGTILIDYQAGARKAVGHLVALGRRAVAVVSGPPASFGGRQRLNGIREALSAHGLAIVFETNASPDLDGGIMAAEKLLGSNQTIDAVICYNDLIAVGLMSRLRGEGASVPEDIAVVGFDDVPMAALVSPALTSLNVAKQDLGETAMRMLLDRMEGRNTQQQIVIEPDLVVRESTRRRPA